MKAIYRNFAVELMKGWNCVSWHWFTYQDNDPLNPKTDPSNRNSNKGVASSSYEPYQPLLDKALNSQVFSLIQFFDK